MEGYCEKHHQPWDIKCVNGQWVCECPKCRAEGLLDTYYDSKTTMLKEKEWMANSHIVKEKRMINIDELREELGFSEQCENCKQNEWHCQRDCYYSLKDFCEKIDIAIETILERNKDTYGCIVEYDENGIPKCNISLT